MVRKAGIPCLGLLAAFRLYLLHRRLRLIQCWSSVRPPKVVEGICESRSSVDDPSKRSVLMGDGSKLLRQTVKQVVQLVCALSLANPDLIWFLIRLCSGSVFLCFLFRTCHQNGSRLLSFWLLAEKNSTVLLLLRDKLFDLQAAIGRQNICFT